jgi:hypothetical protein
MGKVSKFIFSKEISPEPGENANRLQLELSHDGYHLHYRNLRIRIKKEEMPMWKKAFAHAKQFVEHQNLL